MASSITQAREGSLYLMCGGSEDAFRKAEPILKELGSTVRFVGKAGEAAKVKALVNMVMNINTAGLAEGLGLGAALGLDLEMLRKVFRRPARTRACSKPMAKTCRTASTVVSSPPRTPRRTGCARLAHSAGLDLPLARATKSNTIA